MIRLLLTSIIAALVALLAALPASAGDRNRDQRKDKPKSPPETTAPATSDGRDHDLRAIVGLAIVAGIAYVIYENNRETVTLKKSDIADAPMLVYERRF
jgi:hypothetical protein